MVKFPDISGPSKAHSPHGPNNKSMPDPADYTLPDHMGEKTHGVHVDATKALQALDRNGILDKTSPEIVSLMQQAAIYGLGEVVNEKLPTK